MSDGFYGTLQKIPELKVIVHFILKVLKSVVKVKQNHCYVQYYIIRKTYILSI